MEISGISYMILQSINKICKSLLSTGFIVKIFLELKSH